MISELDLRVPMRDGVSLATDVFRPGSEAPCPGLLMRTPYGRTRSYKGSIERLVRAGYSVAIQDSRGRYGSEGVYVPFTECDTGDAEDGYDAVEWLAGQPWCDGRVGTFGSSYKGWMQWQLAKLRPPHLVAMCAYTIPLELTEVDYPGGFRPGRRVKWWLTTMAPDLRRRAGWPPPHTPEEARRYWDEVEQGRWHGLMPWSELPRFLPPVLEETAASWLRQPARRPWRFEEVHAEVEVPNLDFSGWFDHCNGTIAHLGLMQRNGRTETAREASKLMIGPWNHPGLGQREIGEVDFGPDAEVDLEGEMIRWFDHWLKGETNGIDSEPPVRYYAMGAPAERGPWREASAWPPPGAVERTWVLAAGEGGAQPAGRLLPTAVAGGPLRPPEGCDRYTYDPYDPVPTLWTRDHFTVPADRRWLENRSDILYYRSDPLEEELEIAGCPVVKLRVSCSTPDTDFFARLCDEYPPAGSDSPESPASCPVPVAHPLGMDPAGGPAIELCYGMVRARHRNGLDREELLDAGETVEIRILLGPTACRFGRGHRIRLEVTSSDFPNHDRNHNTGGNDLAETRMRAADVAVWCGQGLSSLALPVMASS